MPSKHQSKIPVRAFLDFSGLPVGLLAPSKQLANGKVGISTSQTYLTSSNNVFDSYFKKDVDTAALTPSEQAGVGQGCRHRLH